jgi:ribonuclease HI
MELTAIHLAIKLLWNHVEYRIFRIYNDSQVIIRAIDRPRRQSGQSIIRNILDNIDEITNEHPHLRFEILWIPGHAEIEGNERVDAEAKKAALYKPLKSARIRHIKTAAKKQWQIIWNTNTKTATALRRIMKGRQAKTGPALYNEIASRHGAAIIAQLKTGHCGLNRYLHRFSLRNSPYYRCGYGNEAVEHYLLECQEYRDRRGKLRREVGRG